MTSPTAAAAFLAAALVSGAALAQVSPPQGVTPPLQSGAITGGTSWAVNPRLDADRPQTDKKPETGKQGHAGAAPQPKTGAQQDKK
jgi:hypothetical protein